MSDERKDDLETYSCLILDVFSGDDLVAMVDLKIEQLWKKQRIRLFGVDTPNAVNMADDTDAGAIRRQVRALSRNRRGVIKVHAKNHTSWICSLTIEADAAHGGTIDLNEWLRVRGYIYNRKVPAQ
jgi:hypothetical protein